MQRERERRKETQSVESGSVCESLSAIGSERESDKERANELLQERSGLPTLIKRQTHSTLSPLIRLSPTVALKSAPKLCAAFYNKMDIKTRAPSSP